MNVQVKPDITMSERRLPFEWVALVLQGGGALGAYNRLTRGTQRND